MSVTESFPPDSRDPRIEQAAGPGVPPGDQVLRSDQPVAANDQPATPPLDRLTHVRADGSSHMVDVSSKKVTSRMAVASAVVRTRADVVQRIAIGDLPKGEALAVARIAGIQGAKRTSELIPLCHPLPLTGIEVDLEPREDRVHIRAQVRTNAVTGVEMEALVAVSTAALALYDMIKAVDHLATIEAIQVEEKSGGRSGDWNRAQQQSSAATGPEPYAAQHHNDPQTAEHDAPSRVTRHDDENS